MQTFSLFCRKKCTCQIWISPRECSISCLHYCSVCCTRAHPKRICTPEKPSSMRNCSSNSVLSKPEVKEILVNILNYPFIWKIIGWENSFCNYLFYLIALFLLRWVQHISKKLFEYLQAKFEILLFDNIYVYINKIKSSCFKICTKIYSC
jgi:hypothetical protein